MMKHDFFVGNYKNDLVLALVDAQQVVVERDVRLQLFNRGKNLLASGQVWEATNYRHFFWFLTRFKLFLQGSKI
jgi:hypothetical protein